MPATKADKTSYLLRDIPPDLWARVHRKASQTKGLKIRRVILDKLQEWAADAPSEPQTNAQNPERHCGVYVLGYQPKTERPETTSENLDVPAAEEIVILF